MRTWKRLLLVTALLPLGTPFVTRAADPAPASAPVARQATAGSSTTADDPRISRSRGVEGGAVLLWPRMIPASETPAMLELAGRLQKHLGELVTKVAPTRKVDVRPAPERACPQAGCLAPSAGVLLLNNGTGCAAVALLAAPGQSPTRLVTWAGQLRLPSDTVAFRSPPEQSIKVDDYVPCDKLIDALPAQDAAVEQALKALMPTP